jgi:hypothetical protein
MNTIDPGPGPRTLVGVNVPYFRWYGHDLGVNQSYPKWPTADFDNDIIPVLDCLAASGVRLVKLSLFEDGEGIRQGRDGGVAGIDSAMIRNVERLVALLRERRMSVYWSLFDASSARRREDLATLSILTSLRDTERFAAPFAKDILPVLGEVSWAYEVCSSTDRLVRGAEGNGTKLGVDLGDLLPSLRALRGTIQGASVRGKARVSVGLGPSARHERARGLRERGIEWDFVDVHHTTPGLHDLPHGKSFGSSGGVVGEFYPMSGKGMGGGWGGEGDDWPFGDPDGGWTDPVPDYWRARQKEMLVGLERASGYEYEAIFLWRLTHVRDSSPVSLVLRSNPGLVLHSLEGLRREGAIRLDPHEVEHASTPADDAPTTQRPGDPRDFGTPKGRR